jgi:superfamily II DNA or RNA helicase
MAELREYQTRIIQQARNTIASGCKRFILGLPTGAGKTIIALGIVRAAKEKGNQVLFVADRLQLVTQAKDTFERAGLSVGIIQAENTGWLKSDDVVVASVQTLNNREIPTTTRLVIIDECHVLHKPHIRMLDGLRHVPIIGLSATPMRKGLGRFFDTLVRGPCIRTLIEAGWLVPAKAFAPNQTEMRELLQSVKVKAGDYSEKQLERELNQKVIIADVVKTWKQRGENRQTIVFGVTKAHCRELADYFLAEGVPAAVLVDSTSETERAELLERFAACELRVLVSVAVLSVGFDSPVASCVVLARPTLSEIVHIQQVGRVLRPYEGKTEALILDHSGNTLRFGLPQDFEMPDLDCRKYRAAASKRKKVDKLQTCRECDAVVPNDAPYCPSCGTDRPRRRADVIYADAELVEFGSERSGKPLYSTEFKREAYQAFMALSEEQGHHRRRAFYVYRDWFGEEPPYDWGKLPSLPPTPEQRNRYKHYQIKRAKQLENERKNARSVAHA